MKRMKKCVLLAENDRFLADIYRKKFEQEEYKVLLVQNGESCIKEAEKKLPDIIILDVLLSGIDGFSVIEHLKKNLKTKDIPIIIFTQIAQKEDVKRGLKLGVEYILKAHVKPDDILKKVEEILNIE